MKQSEWIPKHLVCVILKDISTIFTKNTQNVKIVIAKEDYNVNMVIKIKYRINQNRIMKKKIDYYRNKMIDIDISKY